MLKLILFLSLLPFVGISQLIESFDDGNFDQNPSWAGDADLFVVNQDLRLQLNDLDVSKNESYLSINAPTGEFATWRFSVNLDFSPSGSNFCRVYLNSDNSNLTESLNGYYVQLGGISGDLDAVQLIRQNGNNTEVIIEGTPGLASSDPLSVNVEVSRSEVGLWTLLVDFQDGMGLLDQGSANDQTIMEGDYFGMVCNYTSSRNVAFTLDDIFIDPILVDETPPQLIDLRILSNIAIELTFDEIVDNANLLESNFTLNNGAEVIGLTIENSPSTGLILDLNPGLADGLTYILDLNNISDLVGNTLNSDNREFTYNQISIAQEFQILINEFMADPTPQVGLPNAEYIELYNNSGSNFELSEYTLASGGTPVSLPDHLLVPGAYILLTGADEVVNFQVFGDALGLDNFPSLTNSSDEIVLQDATGNIIHGIEYNLDWYQDSDKENGGFSIELINPSNACKGQSNYRASTNLSGGTPTIVNSVDNDEQDSTAPVLANLFTLDNNRLLLKFNEPLTSFSAAEVLNYTLSNGLSVSTAAIQSDASQIILSLSESLVAGTIYTLQHENIADCLGNAGALSDTFMFALPQLPNVGDLLINEVLFNPVSGGVDYVEFYNASNLVFNLSDLQIGNLIPEVNENEPIFIDHLIFPGTYVCITEDKSDVLTRYAPQDSSTIFESELPKLDDKNGNVTLLSVQDFNPVFIDSFDYDEDFHSGFISDKNGVALERISFMSDTNQATNWTSGAQSTNFGTPGYENAQVIRNPTITTGELFDLVNATFSPDQDGFKDFLQIQFTLDQTDYLGSIRIFDDQGREVRQLLPNQIIAPSAIVNWDGTKDDGTLANMGIYILWMELLSSDGDRTVVKEPIVVARNFN